MNITELESLKKFCLGLCLLISVNACKSVKTGSTPTSDAYPEAKLGWKLGSQAYTINRFTFAEPVAKIGSCNLRYVEAFPGHRIGGGIEGSMGPNMTEEKR